MPCLIGTDHLHIRLSPEDASTTCEVSSGLRESICPSHSLPETTPNLRRSCDSESSDSHDDEKPRIKSETARISDQQLSKVS